jgi:hypothetical protein
LTFKKKIKVDIFFKKIDGDVDYGF